MKFLNIISFIGLALSLGSCANWLDLQSEDQITKEQITKTGDGYRARLNGIYKKMTTASLYGGQLQFGILDCMAQTYSLTQDNAKDHQAAAKFEYTDKDLLHTTDQIWKEAYNVIVNINDLIQDLEKESDYSKFEYTDKEYHAILGEAYAVRALIHFDLLKMFAPSLLNDDGANYVPYVTLHPTPYPTGIPVKEFLVKLRDDLAKGRSHLYYYDRSTDGMAISSTGEARFRNKIDYGFGETTIKKVPDFLKGRGFRMSYYAALALESKICMYAGNYADALNLADSVLTAATNLGQMYTLDNFEGIKYQSNPENYTDIKNINSVIFGVYNNLQYDNVKGNFARKTEGGTIPWLNINYERVKFFTNSKSIDERELDVRFKLIETISGMMGSSNISAKWHIYTDVSLRETELCVLPIIRSAELQYIKAECLARKGEYGAAYEILNNLRSLRSLGGESNLQPLEERATIDGFMNDLANEFRREYLGEGQNFYFYKRSGLALDFYDGTKAKLTKAQSYLPLPENQKI